MPHKINPVKIAFLFLLLCMPGIAFAQSASPSSQPGHSFDGAWSVTLVCPTHKDEHGTALAFMVHFTAQVKEGVIHGEYHTKETPPWLVLDGKINPDGSADLTATGLTGKPAYSLGNVPQGTPFTYQVKARFEASGGTGTRIEGRTENFTFDKR
ncbi:MAG: hypothetical protein WCD79_22285 [Chthoniobacteraceae bacterium]